MPKYLQPNFRGCTGLFPRPVVLRVDYATDVYTAGLRSSCLEEGVQELVLGARTQDAHMESLCGTNRARDDEEVGLHHTLT